MTKQVASPTIGNVYMAKRYHNARKVVFEPIRLLAINADLTGTRGWASLKYSGTWLADDIKGNAHYLYPFDKNWAAREITKKEKKMVELKKELEALRKINAMDIVVA